MIKIINSIIVLWSIHPNFKILTFIMVGSWFLLLFFMGGGSNPISTTSHSGTSAPMVTNSQYKSSAPTPSLPTSAYMNNQPVIPIVPTAPTKIKPRDVENATFSEDEKEDDFATIKKGK